MKMARMVLDRDYRIGQVDKRLFGSFLEHLGRAIYTGIYEPVTRWRTRKASARTYWRWSRS